MEIVLHVVTLRVEESLFQPRPKFKSKTLAWESGFGGLEVACWPLIPKFAGSNPARAVGFFRAKKSSARLPSGGK